MNDPTAKLYRGAIERGYVFPDGERLPVESIGECRNVRNCRNYNVILGNGLCMRCWDSAWRDLRKR